jgi:hypothetical protein
MQQDNRDNSTGIQAEAKDNSKVNVAKTINIYESSQPPRGIPFQALALPKDYVDRPEIRQEIKSKLIDCSASRPGTLVVSAIYGLGGVGKSVMAAALAHDREVQEVCTDGVLWVTLGQNPDLLPCLYGWVQALGDYDFNPTTIDSASSHLRSLLRDKKMLLVVDDAWYSDHVAPFQVGGEGCRVLVTTREAHVPDADRIDMDVMSEAESLELLLSKAGVKSLRAEDAEKARKLVAVVGGLPLALDLAGTQIADGVGWNELLEDLEAEIAYLESLDRPNAEGARDEKTRKRLSLKASLNLSLKILGSEQLQQFAWLGVLPEDVSIQPKMAATLWSIPLRQAREVLRTFRAKALLLSGVEGLGQESSYRIHDLMHDLARGLLTGKGEKDIPGLDLQLQDAHGMLLDRYHQQTPAGLWHTLTDDGYILAYLTWHMEQAGRLGDLHGLFQEVTAEGRNGWYELCEYSGQSAKFITDLGRAWKLAEEMYVENTLQSASGASAAIELQVRYALIFSTLNSLASQIPAKLTAALVKNKKWSPAQGLAYAKQAQAIQCFEIIQELGFYLPTILLSEALDIARGIQSPFHQFHALLGLTAHLPDYLLSGVFSELLKLISEIQSGVLRVGSLEQLLAHLPEQFLADALEIVLLPEDLLAYTSLIPQDSNRLFSLIAHLPEIATKALDIVRGLQHESERADALSGLVAYLPNNMFSQALGVARGLQNEYHRAKALSGIAAYLPEIAPEALDEVRRLQHESDRADALNELVAYLPNTLLSQALDIARGLQNEFDRARALSGLATHLPDIVPEALDVVCRLQDEPNRARALSGLATHLPDIVPEALDVELRDEFNSFLTKVGAFVSNISADFILDTTSEDFTSPTDMVLSGIEQIKLTAGEHQNKYSQADALSDLAAHLPNELLSQALDVARGIQDESDRARVLSDLAAHLPNELLSQALDIARGIQNESNRAQVLSDLAAHLPNELLSQALDIARGIQNESNRAQVLSDLAAHLPDDLLLQALDIARGIQDEPDRARALSELATHMPEIASEALDITRGIQNEFNRARVLSGLVAHLPDDLLLQALDIARGIQNESDRARALSGLVAHLPEIASEALV